MKKLTQSFSACGALILFGFSVTPLAHASVISYDFTAYIDSMFKYDAAITKSTTVTSSTTLGALVSDGDTIHGHFYYDEAMPLGPYQPAQPPQGSYQIYYGQGGLDYSIDQSGLQYLSGGGWSILQVANNANSFGWDTFSLYTEIAGGTTILNLYNTAGTAFNDSSIPSMLPRNQFGIAFLESGWVFSGGDQFHLTMNIASLTPTPITTVPEPATYTMLLAGLGLMAFAGRRKRNLG